MAPSPARSDLVAKLKELGISEGTARYALQKENNDVDRAANYVFSGAAARDEVRSSSIERVSSRPQLDPVPEHDVTESPQATAATLSSDSDETAEGDDETSKERGSIEGSRAGRWGRRLSSLPARIRKRVSDDTTTSSVSTNPERAIEVDATEGGAGTEDDKLTDEASDLIRGALSGSTPGKKGSSDKKTVGAIGLLGLKAAAAATTPPSATAFSAVPSSATSISNTGLASQASSARPVVRSQPVGGKAPPRRSPSPFFRARKSREAARKRDTSPEVGALKKDKAEKDAESDGESVGAPRIFRPQASAYETDDSGSEEDDAHSDNEEEAAAAVAAAAAADDDEQLFDEDGEFFDEETSKNTSANAVYFEGDASGAGGRAEASMYDPVGATADTLDNYGEETEQDILGEGPNVVVPPQPIFQTTMFNQPAKKETTKSGLELETSRPVYARDRCTITLTHGDPDAALEESGKRLRRYVVLSDLSEESRYAVEWAVGTVARDGDELFLISVKEDEHKVDPKTWSNNDRAQKLRVQKERQTTCLLLTRQVAGLLQRTRLNITVTCQFLHAKNSRHMLLDLIDFLEPTMCIVGSRGLGKLKGILLGSTSHYLVQKSSVPIMVARRRLQRPLRRTNPAELRHQARTPLAAASIEKTASSKQEDDELDVAGEEGASPDRRASMPALTQA